MTFKTILQVFLLFMVLNFTACGLKKPTAPPSTLEEAEAQYEKGRKKREKEALKARKQAQENFLKMQSKEVQKRIKQTNKRERKKARKRNRARQ